ncbi:MAG TPA: hypothetical protein VMV69_26855 [Pirellulales bacterium]|nr:hypothetical protein [Pirellulales bacterium]
MLDDSAKVQLQEARVRASKLLRGPSRPSRGFNSDTRREGGAALEKNWQNRTFTRRKLRRLGHDGAMRGRKSWSSKAGQSAETDFLVGTGTVLPVFLRRFGCAETAFFISATPDFVRRDA